MPPLPPPEEVPGSALRTGEACEPLSQPLPLDDNEPFTRLPEPGKVPARVFPGELGLCVPVSGSPVQALWLHGPACLRAFRRDADLSHYRDACVTPQCPLLVPGVSCEAQSPRQPSSPPPGPRAPLSGLLRRRFSRASGVSPRAALCPVETMGFARLCSHPVGRWVGRHLQVPPRPATMCPGAAGTKRHSLGASPSVLSPSGAQTKVGRGRSPSRRSRRVLLACVASGVAGGPRSSWAGSSALQPLPPAPQGHPSRLGPSLTSF